MAKLIDLTGQRFGRLTVIKRGPNLYGKCAAWICQCDCGNIKNILGASLRKGFTQSCGCLNKEIINQTVFDLTGQKFGRWTVLEKTNRPENVKAGVYWLCQCECGTIKKVSSDNLRKGISKSCGCLNKELFIERSKKYALEHYNLVGQKFGKLTVIERTDKRYSNKDVVYKCQCNCGNIIEVPGSSLTTKNTQSCGCRKSKGEDKISQILRDNNIPFEMEKSFKDCRNPETNRPFRFDFYVDNKYLIEYDGIQHFQDGCFGENNLKQVQEYDIIKNKYCEEHNIPLIRISYTQYDSLCLEDLLLKKGGN